MADQTLPLGQPVRGVGWRNPRDINRKLMAKHHLVQIRAAIAQQGNLVDVFRRVQTGTHNRIYGGHGGQRMEEHAVGRHRVLTSQFGEFVASKGDHVSSYLQGGFAYSLAGALQHNDILVEVNSQVKWIVLDLQSIAIDADRVDRFVLASVAE